MSIPELKAFQGSNSYIRIAFQQDIPVTARILRLVDSLPFQKLKQIPQLGFVRMVYPSANHTRFEHSLGVYHLALQYLGHFRTDDDFAQDVADSEIELFILSALLHDVGHWPYCHPMEDMLLEGIPKHEDFAEAIISKGEIASLIDKDWSVTPDDVVRFLGGHNTTTSQQFLYRLLSSPIDIDKLDYLQRDSLHAGVPYGRNFDSYRLIRGLRYSPSSNSLSISSKALTATEMMVFARYVMFSEVYWHKTVRAATSMLQRIIFVLRQNQSTVNQLINSTESDFHNLLLNNDTSGIAHDLFGRQRALYKSIYETNACQDEEVYIAARRHDFSGLTTSSARLADQLGLDRQHVIIDAAPQQLEVQFNINVFDENTGTVQALADVSPVVNSLATDQFDQHVKRLRVFVPPQYRNLSIDRQTLLDSLS